VLHGIPTLVDEMGAAVHAAYAAWLDRLYLVGLKGEVVHDGGIGPFGFRPGELKKAMDDYLALDWIDLLIESYLCVSDCVNFLFRYFRSIICTNRRVQ
jgi:hypothetical protein